MTTVKRPKRFLLSGTTSAGLSAHALKAEAAEMQARWPVGTVVDYQQGARQFRVEAFQLGGMGVVYLVTDVDSGEPFVVKTIREHLSVHTELVARFWREVEAWITLEKHPNIVQARGFEQWDGRPYLLLEYVSGGSMRNLLQHEEMHVPDILELAVQIARGMRHATSKGINAHRDLKPDNILMTADRVAKVTDFGLVKFYAEEETAETDLGELDLELPGGQHAHPLTGIGVSGLGTKDYMSPEQWRHAAEVDPRSDIYSFGVMLYEMLTRIRPFYGKTRIELRDQHLNHSPVPPSALRPDIPPSVDSLVARCIEKRPSRRYQNFAELEQELTRILHREYRRVVRLLSTMQLSLAEMNERGAAFFYLGKPQQALASFDSVLALDDGHALAWANRGVSLAEMGLYKLALTSFDRSLAITSDNPVVMMNKALTLMELDRLEEAHTLLQQAVRRNPLLQDAWRYQAELLNRLGWHEPAYYSAYKARQLDPDDDRACQQEAIALYRLGHLEDASAVVAQWEEIVGNREPAVLLLRSQIAHAQGNCRHALLLSAAIPADAPEYVESLKLGMSCALVLGYLDEVAIHRDDMLKAELGEDALQLILDSLDSLGEIRPVQLLALACETAVEVGEFIVAQRLYEDWQKDAVREAQPDAPVIGGPDIDVAGLRNQQPENPHQRLALGILLAQLNQPSLAVEYLYVGLEIIPESLVGWQTLARVNCELEDYHAAAVSSQMVVRLNPEDQTARLVYAEAALRIEDFQSALEAVQDAHSLGAETALSLFLQGAALAGLGRLNAAIRVLDRALGLDSKLSVAWWNQCLCLARLKRPEEARRAMIRARTLDSRMWEHAPYETPPFVPYPLSNTTILSRSDQVS